MRTELKELQRRTGITFVYVTHDQAEALALSDRIAVMQLGKVQQFGTPLEVYTKPANRMVADFMGLVNLLPGKVRDVRNGAGTIELAGNIVIEAPALDGASAGESVEVSIRPENIRLRAPSAAPAAQAKITSHVFLGNISEYYAALPSGQVLRVQTHPLEHFAVGSDVALEIDAQSCSVFRREPASS
jgi:iron(III) transport system ATP-binding protein